MSKPVCPDCGSESIDIVYDGAIAIRGDGTVIVGGVTGGLPREWSCDDCEAVERTDHLADIGDRVDWYWNIERGHPELEAGYEWQMR